MSYHHQQYMYQTVQHKTCDMVNYNCTYTIVQFVHRFYLHIILYKYNIIIQMSPSLSTAIDCWVFVPTLVHLFEFFLDSSLVSDSLSTLVSLFQPILIGWKILIDWKILIAGRS